MEAGERPELTAESQRIWDANAEWWDTQVGEGNQFQRVLIGPATERLLALQPGEEVLDVACGNGLFTRRMAELGARVVACDFSERFLERARARTTDYAERIEFRLVDATDRAQLLALGRRRFDAAVCGMALMDMATIRPLMEALGELLKSSGRFVFSVLHPCFNTAGVVRLSEEEDRGGELVRTHAVKITRYLRPAAGKGLGIVGQPEPHYYFDRPLSLLFAACFEAGFMMDGLEEPAFEPGMAADRPLAWEDFSEIPPVLVARMRTPPPAR